MGEVSWRQSNCCALAGLATVSLVITAGCQTTNLPAAFGESGAQRYIGQVQTALAKDDREAGINAIRSAPTRVDSTFIPWLEDHAAELPPEYFYVIAQRVNRSDPEAALKWWLIGRTRLTYDVWRCTDTSVRDKVAVADMAIQPDMVKILEKDSARAYALGKEALAREVAMQIHPQSPLKICMNGIKGYSRIGLSPAQRAAPINEADWIASQATYEATLRTARERNAQFVESFLKYKK